MSRLERSGTCTLADDGCATCSDPGIPVRLERADAATIESTAQRELP